MLHFGVLVTALLLGVRHAFDGDHITAIDNVVRRLVAKGRSARTVGTWFALGHSAVVFLMAVATVAGAKFAGSLLDEHSPARRALGLFGSLASVVFLLVLGLMNLRVLVAAFQGRERQPGGWLLQRAQLVTQPWQMFFVGFLFGLGFDTASEIALLVLAGAAAASGASVWLALAIPVCFAAGMTFFDTLDGWLMGYAYRGALRDERAARWYNIAITGLSVFLALGVGTVELVGLIAGEDIVDLEHVGYVAVALFFALWAGWFLLAARRRNPVEL
ncbi:high-affinity nickel-transporter [Segniliparus rotundus DSM 44985]|uniref:Nickel/cobalt efflux system n=1 Tax=Segniliparus rotundus (strain ATCC BAA-972 / CDC 1076 / CIP 108378 / DSM 44985 / JCM 13578) TaxID=640132 RepID=D6ZBU7_SEGRD|nr:high frequency lysogenization protein HflD [Segniliparus rotundus]ADG96924.1 high-affinity nickel-transporter [Segniliparus rotundus DSM 44985]